MKEGKNLDELFKAALSSSDDSIRPSQLEPKTLQKQSSEHTATFEKAPIFSAVESEGASPFQKAEDVFIGVDSKGSDLVDLDDEAKKSLDSGLNAELEGLLDEKYAKEKSKRRRGRIIMVVFLLAATGATAGWVASNPEKIEQFKGILAEIRSVADVNEMAAKYDESLEEVGQHGSRIEAATAAMGGQPGALNEKGEDPGFAKEMGKMMGEEGGTTSAERNKKFREKFKSVEKTGSLK